MVDDEHPTLTPVFAVHAWAEGVVTTNDEKDES